MLTYFVLYLYCLTCQPMQILEVHNIPSFGGGSSQWADLECREYGDILSGDFERRNMAIASPRGAKMARKDFIVYSCQIESGEL